MLISTWKHCILAKKHGPRAHCADSSLHLSLQVDRFVCSRFLLFSSGGKLVSIGGFPLFVFILYSRFSAYFCFLSSHNPCCFKNLKRLWSRIPHPSLNYLWFTPIVADTFPWLSSTSLSRERMLLNQGEEPQITWCLFMGPFQQVFQPRLWATVSYFNGVPGQKIPVPCELRNCWPT